MTDQHPANPGEAIRRELTTRGWTHDDLARVLGRYRPEVTNIISGKRLVSPEIAVELAAAFGGSPDYWLQLEASRQLSLVGGDGAAVARRKRLYELAPIRDMEKRGWISAVSDADQLEAELCRFFGVSSLDDEPSLSFSARRSNETAPLSIEQRAWAFRARQIASAIPTAPYDHARLPELKKRLRELAAYPDEARHVPLVLSEFGIRFVVVEVLPGGSIDGAAFWIDERKPAIAMSMRYERVDWFWFTLCHELSHVAHNDALSIDVRLVGPDRNVMPIDDIELRANDEAATMLIPRDKLDSFIRRVGPRYSSDRIVQFAHTIKIHPGIIVGQLHHRGEAKHDAHRPLLAKVRERVLSTAITDGWKRSLGNSLSEDQ